MSAGIKKVHVTHEKYATRTIEEELAILNGREWQDRIGAENCAINHGWSICERPRRYLDEAPCPFAVFNKDDKFIALNRKIRGKYDWRYVFEKELPHGTFDEELQYLNSSEMPWGGPRPIKPPKKQGEPLLRRIVSVFYDSEYSKWVKEEEAWKSQATTTRFAADVHLSGGHGWGQEFGGNGWQVLLNDKQDFYEADKPVMWEKYGRRIMLVPNPDNPYVARFVEVTN
jgi:hypothetical protein